MKQSIYIKAHSQISLQQPLSEEWFSNPIEYSNGLHPAIDPDFRAFIGAAELRRLGKTVKRAVATSSACLAAAQITVPDAIITGTGLGCNSNNQNFLLQMLESNEQEIKPTYFINSTHNTISSLLAIRLKAKGYNSTYSHGSLSFDCALKNACTLLGNGRCGNVLLNACDEMTESYYALLQKAEISDPDRELYGECSVSFLLSTDKENALCKASGIKLSQNPDKAEIQELTRQLLSDSGTDIKDIDGIVCGIGSNETSDRLYLDYCSYAAPKAPIIRYKHLFGNGYSASAAGFYAAAVFIEKNSIPGICLVSGKTDKCENLLVMNLSDSGNFSLSLLTKIK